MTPIDRTKLKTLQQREESRFLAEHPKSAALYQRAQSSLLGGVPMNWMKKWAGAFPISVKSANGAHFTDVDSRDYIDLCLGDTGAMTGHSPAIVAEAVARRAKEGITFMLPTEDALWVGEDLQRRFGLPYWQFTLTATDANRFSIRIAREITQRSKILVFHYCYHGTVDESFATLENGVVAARRGNIGPPVNPVETTLVVEFNDLNALEDALKHRDVACILAEPAMTNVGIILPDDGYWRAAREHLEDCDVGGIGGTLAGNALSLAAMRATLEHILTPKSFEHMIPLAQRFNDGVAAEIRAHQLPWNVIQLGARAEYTFAAKPPRNGGESAAAADFELERFLHLYALNRGVLLTP